MASSKKTFIRVVGALASDLVQKAEQRGKFLKEGFELEEKEIVGVTTKQSEADVCLHAIALLDQVLKLEKEFIKSVEMDKEILQNKDVYWRNKNAGDFKDDWWVVIAQKELVIHTSDRKAALKAIAERKVKNGYFTRVGASFLKLYHTYIRHNSHTYTRFRSCARPPSLFYQSFTVHPTDNL